MGAGLRLVLLTSNSFEKFLSERNTRLGCTSVAGTPNGYVIPTDLDWIASNFLQTYVISRFVSKGNRKVGSGDSKTRERLQGAKEALQVSASSSNGIPMPHVHTPAAPDVSGFTTPNPSMISSVEEFDSLWSEAPDETLHCISMNEVCFKSGRVTVPTALVLAGAGCGLSPEKWAEVKKLRSGGQMRELVAGGWRDVPESERWWDQAMLQFEKERVRRLHVLKGMRDGLEVARLL